jgi:HlyD family secretion protein
MSQPLPGLARTSPKSEIGASRPTLRLNPRAIITSAIFLAAIGFAIWYLARPEPLLVKGEAESTRIDIAARVSGQKWKSTLSAMSGGAECRLHQVSGE